MEHIFWSTEEDWKVNIPSSVQVLTNQMPLETLTNDLTKEFGHLDLKSFNITAIEKQLHKFIIDRKLASPSTLLTLTLSSDTIFSEIG